MCPVGFRTSGVREVTIRHCVYRLQKELYHLALQHASGPVRTSFSMVSPDSAVYQVR